MKYNCEKNTLAGEEIELEKEKITSEKRESYNQSKKKRERVFVLNTYFGEFGIGIGIKIEIERKDYILL